MNVSSKYLKIIKSFDRYLTTAHSNSTLHHNLPPKTPKTATTQPSTYGLSSIFRLYKCSTLAHHHLTSGNHFMSNSLIQPDQHFAIAGTLFAIAAFSMWAEQKPWGKLLTGAVWSILIAIAASNLGLIPRSAPTYSFIFTYLVPVLIPLFLMNANIKQLIFESGRVGLAFILACIGTVAGSILGITLIDLGPHAADLAGIFTATYTGGSVNYAAVIQSTGFDDTSVISAATAVDNLMSAIFLAAIAVLPAFTWLSTRFATRDHSANLPTDPQDSAHTTPLTNATSLAFALIVVALSDLLVLLINSLLEQGSADRYRYIFITLLSIAPASLSPKTMAHFSGGQSLGMVIAFVFFAAIAAGADLFKLVNVAPMLLAFVSILLLTHFLVVFGGGMGISLLAKRFSKSKHNSPFALSLPETIIASNAAILGATTAPALAVARGWPALASPGVLAGVAGYVVGTPLGILVASIL